MGTGPFEDGTELEAAQLLRALSDYMLSVVRQELLRAQLQRDRRHVGLRDRRLTAGGLLALLGTATLVAAAVIALATVLGAGFAAVAIGTALLVLATGLILSAGRRATRTSRPPS